MSWQKIFEKFQNFGIFFSDFRKKISDFQKNFDDNFRRQLLTSKELERQGIDIPPVKRKTLRDAFDEATTSTDKGKGKGKGKRKNV